MNQPLRTSPLSLVTCLATCLGISAFWVSSASAQVNGLGPSPASDFDIVFNLPGDEAEFSSSSESIGGVFGLTQLNITSGGILTPTFFSANAGSEVNINGGDLGNNFTANSGSEVNIGGGSVGFNFDVFEGSVVNISGGTFGNTFDAFSGSTVNFSGSEFFIEGVALDTLAIAQAFTITQRDIELSGLLADGEPFSFNLNSNDSISGDFFSPEATVTVTLFSSVPEPSSGALITTVVAIGFIRRRRC